MLPDLAKKNILYILFFLKSSLFSILSQTKENKLDSFFINLQKLEFKLAEKNISTLNNKNLHNLLILIKDNKQSYKYNIDDQLYSINKSDTINLLDKSLYNLSKGIRLNFYFKQRVKAYTFYTRAYQQSKQIKNEHFLKLVLKSILDFYLSGNLQSDNTYLNYLLEYKKTISTPEDFLFFFSIRNKLTSQREVYSRKNNFKLKKLKANYFKSYDSLIKTKTLTSNLLFIYYIDKGNFIIRDNPQRAKKYYLLAKKYLKNSLFYKPYKYIIYSNLSRTSNILNKHVNGIKYIDSAKIYRSYNDSLKNSIVLNSYLGNHYANLKIYDSAYFLAEKNRLLGYKYNFQKHNREISQLKVNLETEKKEKENIELKAKRKQDKYIIIIGSIFLILGSIIAFLNLKNSRKKRLLAEQQQELEKQRNLTLLKEQEINTINAMINGQEKERIRIAEDLHDNIGSVLATLKLHFENLKLNREKKHFNQEELYNKTEKLIDETYLKVRNIAHAKNAGVIANKGLLVAVKLMAEKISDANKIRIEVLDYGLDKRLDNNLEITIFRIIQELTTNIIKHANATEATISISQFDENLNIIIEDNGKGFNVNIIKLKDGIGISSIKTRITHLNGTFEIDSTLGKGSSIIMNIPVN